MLAPWRKSYDKPRQHIKKQTPYFADRGPCSQSYGFSSSHVWRWELHHKEGWAPKNWCFQTVVLEKTLESPLDLKEIQPVHPKGNQSWIFIGRTDAEAEAPVLWPLDANSWLICCKQPTHCITYPSWKHSVAPLWRQLFLQDILQTNIFYSISKYKDVCQTNWLQFWAFVFTTHFAWDTLVSSYSNFSYSYFKVWHKFYFH